MALGADDKQAAGGADLIRLVLHFFFILIFKLGEGLPRVQDFLVVGLGKAGGLGDQLVGEFHLAHFRGGHELGVAAQDNIGTAARHVGGDGDRAELAGLRDDLRLALVLLGVEDLMLDARALEGAAELFALFDADGTHQHRLALLVALPDLPDDSVELRVLGLEQQVGVVGADHGLVGGDLDAVEAVDFLEFVAFGHRRTGHAGKLFVKPEIVLEGDGGEGLALVLDADALLRFDGLMQAVGIPSAQHDAAGEFVDDQNLAVLDHVVDIQVHGAVGLQRLVDVVLQGQVVRVHQVFKVEILLRLGDTGLGERGGFRLLVDHIVALVGEFLFGVGLAVDLADLDRFQTFDEIVHDLVQIGGFIAAAGNDQGRSRLVNQDRVHLVDDGEGVAALHPVLFIVHHVVAQVVEAHFVVGAVGDVGGVGFLAFGVGLFMNDQADAQTEEPVNLAHPFGVALRQIIVDGDDVNAVARQGVQIRRKRGDQGFSLAGLHFSHAALMQHHAADDLHAEMLHAQHAPGRLAADREGLRQDIVQRRAVRKTRLELVGLRPQLLVGQLCVFFLIGHDLVRNGLDPFYFFGGIVAENF